MKPLLLAITGLSLAVGIVAYVHSTQTKRPAPALPATAAQVQEPEVAVTMPLRTVALATPADGTTREVLNSAGSAGNPAVTQPQPTSSLSIQRTIETLLSAQASFDEKQAAWQQLKDCGKLDLAINELERGAASNPNSAQYPAALGQAYLQKAATLKDIREQGILGMKADQSFDTALSQDPSNWEAGFWKAAALSYWPPQLNKGQEVVERFAELIKLQETQPSQPQFAQTYVLLGEQYQKQGYADYARQIWRRGSALFPNDPRILEKLTQAQPQQAAAAH